MSKVDGAQELRRSLFEQKLSRASFLRLVGAGVGLSFIPASLACSGGGIASTQTLPILLDTEQFPIGLWWPPPPTQTTAQRYQEIAAAGFNFVIGGNGVINDTYNPAALEAAQANNLQYVLWDSQLTKFIRDSANYSDPQAQVRNRIQQLWQRYQGYPAWAGLYLYDEPSTDEFALLGYARAQTQQQSSGRLLPFANLYPYTNGSDTLASLGATSYDDYLKRYRSEVSPPFICFDHYPLLSGSAITEDYFQNWAAIRNYALKTTPNLPGVISSWVFIQSVDFSWTDDSYPERRKPNEDELFWQVNVSLAYGAKGIQYFCYWTPSPAPDALIQFGEALVSTSGNLSPLYDYAKRVNAYLKVVGKALLPLRSASVAHAGEDPLPAGATAFSNDGYVTSVSGSPVILGSFSNPTIETERFLLVVNRSFTTTVQPTLTLSSSSVKGVSKLDSGTDMFVNPSEYSQGQLKPSIAAGRAQLYKLQI